MRGFSFLVAIMYGWCLASCGGATPEASAIEEMTSSTDTLLLSAQRLILTWGERGLAEAIYPINEEGLRDGTAVEYDSEGKLLSISHYEEGLLDGNSWFFDGENHLHRIYTQGTVVYEGSYHNHQKTATRLYPQVVEEFLFEDKYYTKIKFPLPYAGHINIQVEGHQAVVVAFPQQTFQLVINDALDLVSYQLALSYEPAAEDSLLRTAYHYQHVVYDD